MHNKSASNFVLTIDLLRMYTRRVWMLPNTIKSFVTHFISFLEYSITRRDNAVRIRLALCS